MPVSTVYDLIDPRSIEWELVPYRLEGILPHRTVTDTQKVFIMDDTDFERNLLVDEAKGYLSILGNKGIQVSVPDFQAMSLADLKTFVRRLRDMARTPSGD